jgi:hypothetical protein
MASRPSMPDSPLGATDATTRAEGWGRRRRRREERVIDNPIIRSLLVELAQTLPEDGSQVTGLSVRQGWGGIVNVQVHTSVWPSPDWELGAAVRSAVRRALGAQRHELTFVWDETPARRNP